MVDLTLFRKHYNDYLHGELQKLERQRKRLVFLLVVSVLFFVLFGVAILIADIPALTMFLLLPIVFWTSVVAWRIRVFKNNFKPKILPIILDFIDKDLRYYASEYIPRDTFMRSGIFGVVPDIYKGEDYIKGQIGEIDFEMCELDVRHTSAILGKMVKLFQGIFFHALMPGRYHGKILIIPLENRQMHTKTIRAITKIGGVRVTGLHEEFEEHFIIYAEKDINPRHVLTHQMLEAFSEFRRQSRKNMYISFVDEHFYAAIEEPYNLLEPNILLPNVDFELMTEYYQDLMLLTELVEDFDLTH